MSQGAYSLKEVSQRVGMGIEGLYRLIRLGRLSTIRPGGERGRYYVPQAELDRLLQARGKK